MKISFGPTSCCARVQEPGFLKPRPIGFKPLAGRQGTRKEFKRGEITWWSQACQRKEIRATRDRGRTGVRN